MNSLFKRVRHFYWLITHFVRKNLRFLITSFVAGFFLIIIFLNFFPYIQNIFTRKNEIIGITGQYSLQSTPNEVTQLISSPLITISAEGDITPVLAHSWEVLDDGKRYRFHIRNDLFWTDKRAFRAGDLTFNFKDVTVEVVDDYTVDFILTQPLNIFPIYLTKPVIKYPLSGVGALYTVDHYKTKGELLESIHLSPNKNDLPYKIYKFYATEDDLVNAYKKGEITHFTTQNKNVKSIFDNWDNTVITKNINPNEIMTLFINTDSSLLKDRDVRKGLSHAISNLDEFGSKARSPIPPTSWAYSEDVRDYPYNDERARSLLGTDDSNEQNKFQLTMASYFDYLQTAELLKKNFEAVGVAIDIKVVSYIPDEYDLFLTVWNPPNDPDQYFFWHSTQSESNLTRFKNAKIDKLLEDGRRVVNVKQRKSLYADFQRTLTDEVPAIFLYHPFVYTIERK